MISRLLTSGLHGEAFQKYVQENHPEIECLLANSEEESIKMLPEVEALAGFNFLAPSNLHHIKWIHSFGAGIDGFLNHQLSEDLVMTKTTGGMGDRIAEYCLTYMLQSLQQVAYFKQQQQSQQWQQRYLPQLSEVVVYVFGTGFIGQAIAKLLTPLVHRVIGINTTGTLHKHFNQCLSLDASKKHSFEKGAVVINALPLTKQTKNLFDDDFFQLMEQVLFINIGRGGSVAEDSLLKALKSKQIQHAVLDVFNKEPLPKAHPFWQQEQITITPHISGITSFSDITSSFQLVYEAIKSGKEIPNQVLLERQY